MKRIFGLLTLTLALSCQSIIDMDKANSELKIEGPKFSILFSHSISGETHPCGCRQFPLGGLPQVAGFMHELKKEKQFLYVDTGDMLFPSSIVPTHIAKSQMQAAKDVAKGLDKLGLKYTLPGDQDLAAGVGFYKEVLSEVSFTPLVSNLSDEKKKDFPHQEFTKIVFGKKTVYLTGIVEPSTIQGPLQGYFKRPEASFPETLKKLKEAGYDEKNPLTQLVVMSHAGLDYDKGFAKKFPMIDWIIGSHSQSFTNYSIDVGDTQIVQVLSKNHYIGEIAISSGKEKLEKEFSYHEMREQLGEKIPNNPFTAYINESKKKLDQIRDEEQKMMYSGGNEIKKIPDAKSCLECHEAQGEHWAKTPHSVSFATLMIAGEENKTSCMKCHSVGMNEEGGYINHNDIVHFKDLKTTDKGFSGHKNKYWQDVSKAFKDVKSIRKLSDKKVSALRVEWDKLDEKHKVEHSYANVQCLNCHEVVTDHPFAIENDEQKLAHTKASIKNKCLECHTSDQSPEWYKKDRDGVYSGLDEDYFEKMYKKMVH
ncbi:multiheme c-type cytochrome [Halobacteriovorax sp. YZS-1-1]|uniref:multiheme c-type cytochrome n=1 Tax=unclassified Halobacteriovorax TaxID=2639665 RepID=UPI00399B22C9